MAEDRISFRQSIQDGLTDYMKVIALVIRSVTGDNITILASGLVYSTLVALVPFSAIMCLFMSAFGVIQIAIEGFESFLANTFGAAVADQILVYLESYSTNALSLGIAGVVSFVVTTILLINKIYNVINTVFRTKAKNGTIGRFSAFLTFLIVVIFMLGVLFMFSSKAADFFNRVANKTGYSLVHQFLSSVVYWLILGCCLLGLLFFVPNAKIRFRSALIGAVSGTLALLLATSVFKSIVRICVNYSMIYGSLASVLFLLLFFYIFWFIIILSAEITFIHQFRPEKSYLLGRPQTPERQFSEAINLLLIIIDTFQKGNGGISERELSKRLAIPAVRLYAYLNDFEDAGFIVHSDARRSCYLPAKPAAMIKMKDVITVLFRPMEKNENVETIGEAVAMEFYTGGSASFQDLTVENLLERV